MASTIKHKRGDTIDWTGFYKINNVPINLTNIDISCQFRKADGTLLFSPEITKLNQITDTGKYTIKVPAHTVRDFPVEKLKSDIQYTDSSGNVTSTETFFINILEDVTI